MPPRRAPLDHRSATRRAKILARVRYTGPSAKVRRIVRERSGGVCEFPDCGRVAVDPHHRFERGMGGVGSKGPDWINNASNILAACRHHNDWVSNQQPHEAWVMGWRLKPGELPQETPVQLAGGTFLLDDDGGKTEVPA